MREFAIVPILPSHDGRPDADRKSTRLNSSHPSISYAVFCLKNAYRRMGSHSGVRVPRHPAKPTSPFPPLDPALKRGGRLAFERRLTVLTLLCGFFSVGRCVRLLWFFPYSGRLQ